MADGIQRFMLGVKDGESFADALEQVADETERVFLAVWILHTQGHPINKTRVCKLLGKADNWFKNATESRRRDREQAFDVMKGFLDDLSGESERGKQLQERLDHTKDALSDLENALADEKEFNELQTSLYVAMHGRDNARIVEEMRNREPANLQEEKRRRETEKSRRRERINAVPDPEEDS